MVFTRFGSLVIAASALAISSATAAAATPAMPRVHPSVHRSLRRQGTVNLILTMKGSTNEVLNSLKETKYSTRAMRVESVVNTLEEYAQSSQEEVAKLVNQDNTTDLFVGAQSFWISNQVQIVGATAELLEKLRGMPSIAELREERTYSLLPVSEDSTNSTNASIETSASIEAAGSTEWGITKVHAPEMWAAGFKGQDVVVGAIDTGVLHTHEALKSNWRGDYGWYDPKYKKPEPYDDHGHGSHVIGTIAGQNGIGVAPGATWMMCRGCTSEGCSEADLLACAQFMTCPTDPQGKNKDCSKAPRVVSNSWGGGQGETFYDAAIDAWRAAGIIPVFANGNEGPECGTASSPGDNKNVIAVGATDKDDGLAPFSNRGPAKNGLLKPEVSAPGHQVRSSWNDGNYKTISGTSMATPHVSGVVALLLSANPSLKYDDIKALLTETADTSTLKATRQSCGGTADGKFPNNQYGYGRVNVLNAYKKASGGSTPSPTSTTVAPAPTRTTPAPTSTTTVPPTSSSPSPSTKTPSPTTKTPKPTPTKKPVVCEDLRFYRCFFTKGCYWDFWNRECFTF